MEPGALEVCDMADNDEGEWMLNSPDPDLLGTDVDRGSRNAAKKWRRRSNSPTGSSPSPLKSKAVIRRNPFADLTGLSDTAALDAVTERSPCPACSASRMYFCYTCHVAVPNAAAAIPVVRRLPIKVDIVKHRSEVDGKSTAVHAAVVCPDQVRLFTYPDIPDYRLERAVLVYPGSEAKTLQETFGGCGPSVSSFDRVVFIDCTWKQAHGIYSDDRLNSLPQVIIDGRETAFWRGQKGKSDGHLATIEAVYYFLRDYSEKVLRESYGGEYDNLLYLFKYMYDKIHALHT